MQTNVVDSMLQSADTSTSCAVTDTLSVLRRLAFLHRLEWTFNSEQIPLPRHILSSEDIEPTGSSEEQRSQTVSVVELQSFLQQCIPEVHVQLRVSCLQRLVPDDSDDAGKFFSLWFWFLYIMIRICTSLDHIFTVLVSGHMSVNVFSENFQYPFVCCTRCNSYVMWYRVTSCTNKHKAYTECFYPFNITAGSRVVVHS